jgi:transposase
MSEHRLAMSVKNTSKAWSIPIRTLPWEESSVMEERLRFVARLLDGEATTDVCRDFGISRKTGYKVFDRYTEHGLEALTDRSRRPVRYANQLRQQLESLIVNGARERQAIKQAEPVR